MNIENDYPSRNEILRYLNEILKKYDIESKINYNFNVENIEFNNNYYVINKRIIVKYLAICTGLNSSPNLKLLNKLKKYTGEIHHNINLKNYDLF